jgi:hypothetical protein
MDMSFTSCRYVHTRLLLDPRFAGSNSAEDNGFLRAIKIRSATSFGGEVKLTVSFHKIYGMLKNPTSMKEILLRKNSAAIYRQVSPTSLLGFSAGNCLRALVDESGMIRTLIGKQNRSVMVVAYGTPCTIPHRNSNSTPA